MKMLERQISLSERLTLPHPEDIPTYRLSHYVQMWSAGSAGRCSDVVVVTYAGTRHQLTQARPLTFGRAASCDVNLPPQDDHLSRIAGALSVLTDCVLVRNVSSSKPFVLRPPSGEDRVVEPGAAITSLPYREFEIVLAGKAGSVVTILVDARAVTPEQQASTEPVGRDKRTVTAPLELSATQRRVLLALCEPLLTRHGHEAQPSSYNQIGRMLGLSPQYSRNVIKALREELAGMGLAGLTAEDSGGAGEDFRWPLARWAIRNGWVNAVDARALFRDPDPNAVVPGPFHG